jgi:hypothetical protein
MLKKLFGVQVVILLSTVLSLVNTPYAKGQAISGDITGTVVDASGAVVPNVLITAENVATGVKTSATTGVEGAYRLSNLSVGTYTLSAICAGFTPLRRTDVNVQLSTTVTQNLFE